MLYRSLNPPEGLCAQGIRIRSSAIFNQRRSHVEPKHVRHSLATSLGGRVMVEFKETKDPLKTFKPWVFTPGIPSSTGDAFWIFAIHLSPGPNFLDERAATNWFEDMLFKPIHRLQQFDDSRSMITIAETN